jgi:hypothetical protein
MVHGCGLMRCRINAFRIFRVLQIVALRVFALCHDGCGDVEHSLRPHSKQLKNKQLSKVVGDHY